MMGLEPSIQHCRESRVEQSRALALVSVILHVPIYFGMLVRSTAGINTGGFLSLL